MKYFLGSFITLLLLYFFSKIRPSVTRELGKNEFRYSQSHIHEVVKPFLPPIASLKRQKFYQSSKHEEKTNIKVIIMGNKAYWIRDNAFYEADLDGKNIDRESARIVDTMQMDKVQLDKMLFIMDQLRDGKSDDSGNPGN